MKGHEDGGNVLWNARRSSEQGSAQYETILRKEVIQPQVPLRLPCYDFVPLTGHTFDASLLAYAGLGQRLRVQQTQVT